MQMRKIHIGTSGWDYKNWIGKFYEKGCVRKDMLPRYVERFSTVEVNNTFYRLPERSAVSHWAKTTPDHFLFSVKASRYLTHMKKLKEHEDGLERLFTAISPLKEKLGPILFQLPPSWNVNLERLREFTDHLPDECRYTFEFRDRSWLCDDVYEILKNKNLALCFYDYRGFQSPEIPTADFIYVRLHGPEEKAYTGSYNGRTLAGYAKKFLRWRDEGKEIFGYFDNDDKSHAPNDARKLIDSLERQLG